MKTTLGRRIASVRYLIGESQHDFATTCGITRVSLSGLEQDKATGDTLSLRKVNDVLGYDISSPEVAKVFDSLLPRSDGQKDLPMVTTLNKNIVRVWDDFIKQVYPNGVKAGVGDE